MPPVLAFHLITGALAPSLLETGVGDLEPLKLVPEPLITERNLVAYVDCDDSGYPYHRMRLRAPAIARLPREPSPAGTPFIVSVGSERLYLGVFLREQAACANRVPTILIDPERADGLYDWYWIHRSHPNRIHRGRDPRSDPRLRAALRDLGLFQPLESKAWWNGTRAPLAAPDGTSGILLRLDDTDVRDHLRGGGRSAFPSIRGEAVTVDDPTKQPAGQAELNPDYACRLPLPPGVYHVGVRIEWCTRTAPPHIPTSVIEVPAHEWVDVSM